MQEIKCRGRRESGEARYTGCRRGRKRRNDGDGCRTNNRRSHFNIEIIQNGKAPGEDCIPIELITKGSKEVLIYLHKLILTVWRSERVPKEWTEAIIVPLYKKGDKLECKN